MFKEKYTMNKWINSFSTEEEYYAYINGDTDHYPSISFIESTNSVYILESEPEPESSYSIEVSDVEEGGELEMDGSYWVELHSDGVQVEEPFDGEFRVQYSGDEWFEYEFERDDTGGVDGTLQIHGGEVGDGITITYVQDGVTLASSSYVIKEPFMPEIQIYDYTFTDITDDALSNCFYGDHQCYVKLYDDTEEEYMPTSSWFFRVIDPSTYQDAERISVTDGSNDGFSDSYRIDFGEDIPLSLIFAAYMMDSSSDDPMLPPPSCAEISVTLC